MRVYDSRGYPIHTANVTGTGAAGTTISYTLGAIRNNGDEHWFRVFSVAKGFSTWISEHNSGRAYQERRSGASMQCL